MCGNSTWTQKVWIESKQFDPDVKIGNEAKRKFDVDIRSGNGNETQGSPVLIEGRWGAVWACSDLQFHGVTVVRPAPRRVSVYGQWGGGGWRGRVEGQGQGEGRTGQAKGIKA